jgi:quercetin dioxygenase-like cupin family protein
MSVRRLAALTNFSPSFISQVENGQASPSISSMERIAGVLGVTLGEFFAAASEGEAELIIRPGERLQMESGWSQGQVEALGPMTGGRQLEPVLITLEPGGRSGKHPYAHAVEEFGLVLEGKVSLTLGPRQHELGPGDAVTIRPDELRLWRNTGTAPARFLIVSSRFSMAQAGHKAGPRRAAVPAPRRRKTPR